MSTYVANTAYSWSYRTFDIKTSTLDALASSSYIANTANE